MGHNHLTGVEAETVKALLHFFCCQDRASRVLVIIQRSAKYCQNSVSEEFIDRAGIFEDSVGHLGQIFIEHFDNKLRVFTFRKRRKTSKAD